MIRARWAALGAAVAVAIGGGGIGLVGATSPSDATAFVAITPCRVVDTRPAADFNTGPKATPLGPGEKHTVNTTTGDTGQCSGIPTSARAVALNVTALGATLPTFLVVWPTGADRPDASNLNPAPGSPPVPNAVTTGLDANGRFDIFNRQGNVDVIADIVGYYVDHDHDDRYYTQAQVETKISDAVAPRAIAADVYNKTETDARIATATGGKANAADVYLKGDVYTKAEVDSEITAAVGLKLAISPAAFIGRYSGTGYEIGSGGQLAVTTGDKSVLFAPINLPHGATLTSMRATVWDTAAPADIRVTVGRIAASSPTYVSLLSGSSTHSSGEQSITRTGSHVIDNQNNSYYVELDVPGVDWSDYGYALRFHHLVIDYTLP